MKLAPQNGWCGPQNGFVAASGLEGISTQNADREQTLVFDGSRRRSAAIKASGHDI